jgi:HEPN domain-containing protein
VRNQHSGASEQAKAAKHRFEDAQVLFAESRWRGSMYLAGYSVECLLKAALMKRIGVRNLMDLEDALLRRRLMPAEATVFTHHLVQLTGGLERLRDNAAVFRAFNVVNRWSPAWRYWSDPSDEKDAALFLRSVATLTTWIENNV